jgi:hypothetical protein
MLAGKEQDLVNNAIQRSMSSGNSPRDALVLEGFPKEKITPELEKTFKKIVEGTNPDGTVTSAAIKEYQNLKKLVPAEGSLYTIDLPDPAIARMLDWDRPFSQQPESARRALQDAGVVGRDDWLISGMKGREIYNRASFGAPTRLPLKQQDDQIYASQRLREAGIPGIRYLDQGSRGTGAGTSNFVVFPGEEDLLRILSVNGGLLSP